MQILALRAVASSDADAPWASIPIGPGTAPGRLRDSGPGGHPPRSDDSGAGGGKSPHSGLQQRRPPGAGVPRYQAAVLDPSRLARGPADTNVVYLSMSVDVANYVYILSQNGNGYDAADFNLDVYTPAGEHLFFQQGLLAAGLAVDLWRNVYTLNFQQISGPGGRTEPSISEYTPSTPKVEAAILAKRRGDGPAASRTVAALDIGVCDAVLHRGCRVIMTIRLRRRYSDRRALDPAGPHLEYLRSRRWQHRGGDRGCKT